MTEKMRNFTVLMLVVLVLMLVLIQKEREAKEIEKSSASQVIQLPQPVKKGGFSVEAAILKRRSRREFSGQALKCEQVSQLLWAAQGITDPDGSMRAVPSAGALYPLEIYAVCPESTYHYLPKEHSLERISDKDLRSDLSNAAMGQTSILDAPMDIVITAVFERTTAKYGERGIRYAHMEAGHCAQNIQLQAVALGLGSVPVGAFSDDGVSKVLGLPAECKPLYIIPVGYPQ